MIPKTLKAKPGRIEQATHLDLIEVEWVDASSTASWMSQKSYSPLSMCYSVGYFDSVETHELTGKKVLSMYGDFTEAPKLNGRHHSIPIQNIVSVRIVSKGVKVGKR